MFGFNSRFGLPFGWRKEVFGRKLELKSFVYSVNAGTITPDHWTQDRKIGGGRIIGEVCHFIDLLRFLAAAKIIGLKATRIGSSASEKTPEDKVTITLSFADGSHGTIHYFANGSRVFPKERLEVFCGGRILQLYNFRVLHGYNWGGTLGRCSFRQDKGHKAEVDAFMNAVRCGGSSPIPFDEIVEVAKMTFEADTLARA